jgi:POT family proton-dependent oligopeptide transporter
MSDRAGTIENTGIGSSEPAAAGYPRGLFYLVFTEGWERFSYYGMTALLSLYMVNQLLLPGHVEHIAGFAVLRGVLESLLGPLSKQALAAQIFGLYTGFVYFTPLLGSIIADRWIGARNAVVIGALSMSAGHIAMTFDGSFLLALLLLVMGSGFLKGNIAAQVGTLYPADDEARRTRGFILFSTGINVGAVTGPLLCGLLAQIYGWHWGFGMASVFMLLGLSCYLYGYRYLPARVARSVGEHPRLTPDDHRLICALIVVMIITIFQSVAYYQLYNVMPLWIQQHVRPAVAGFQIPIPWYQSINSITSIICVPLLLWVWRYQAARHGEPDDLAKIGIGAWIAAASNLILVAASLASGSPVVDPIWPLLNSVGLGIAFMYYWPTLLALVSRAAPAKLNATLVAIAYMSLFVSNILVGWIGGLYEKMRPAEFWALHAAIGAGGGLLIVLFGERLRQRLRNQ